MPSVNLNRFSPFRYLEDLNEFILNFLSKKKNYLKFEDLDS